MKYDIVYDFKTKTWIVTESYNKKNYKGLEYVILGRISKDEMDILIDMYIKLKKN